jgi:hypothetical protein
MNGGKMTDVRAENEEKWRVATNKVIAENLIEQVAELVNGEVHHHLMVDHKGVIQRKISIIYTEDSK